jgi:hypothetical protein
MRSLFSEERKDAIWSEFRKSNLHNRLVKVVILWWILLLCSSFYHDGSGNDFWFIKSFSYWISLLILGPYTIYFVIKNRENPIVNVLVLPISFLVLYGGLFLPNFDSNHEIDPCGWIACNSMVLIIFFFIFFLDRLFTEKSPENQAIYSYPIPPPQSELPFEPIDWDNQDNENN